MPRLLFGRKLREKLQESAPDHHTPGLREVPPDDLFELCPVTHHQKRAVFDRSRVHIAGLDLDERRFGGKDHGRDRLCQAPQPGGDRRSDAASCTPDVFRAP